MIPALDAANYLVTLDDLNTGDLSSNLKLQKLLYYAQGVHLALHGKPLFDEKIEAWDHGPVCPSVYAKFKKHGNGPIPPPIAFTPTSLPSSARDTLDEVYRVYGQFSAWRLREMTHAEPPWKNTYREGIRNIEIPREAMRAYFSTQLK